MTHCHLSSIIVIKLKNEREQEIGVGREQEYLFFSLTSYCSAQHTQLRFTGTHSNDSMVKFALNFTKEVCQESWRYLLLSGIL